MNPAQPLVGGISPIVFGLALLLAERLLAPPDEEQVRDLVRRALTILGSVLIVVGLFGRFLVLLGFCLLPLGLAVLPAGLIVVLMMKARQYRANRQALLRSLAMATERLMPLIPVFEAFAAEGQGGLPARARRMARLLRSGMILPEAIDACPGLLPREVAMTLRVGYQAGALPRALGESASVQGAADTLWHRLAARLIYLLILLAFATNVVLFMMLKIVPQFCSIFRDYEVRLPASTLLMISVSEMLNEYAWIIFLASLPIWLLALYAVLRYVGLPVWDPPLVRRFTRRFHSEAILRALAVIAERGQPMPEGIAAMANRYPAGWIRRRLHGVLADVEAGQSWSESLAARGLISRADRGVLEAAQRVGNLAWALREMAASNVRRLLYRLNLAVQLTFPVVIVAFGLIEAIFVFGCFMPLVVLIQTAWSP